MFLISCSQTEEQRPKKLQERVFEKLFEIAEIAQFSREELRAYEDSLRHYRDLRNSIDSARAEGEKIGIEKEGKKPQETFFLCAF